MLVEVLVEPSVVSSTAVVSRIWRVVEVPAVPAVVVSPGTSVVVLTMTSPSEVAVVLVVVVLLLLNEGAVVKMAVVLGSKLEL